MVDNPFVQTDLGTYILDDEKNVVKELDMYKWGIWFGTHNRRVGHDYVHNLRVSTVFLGLDHRMGSKIEGEGPVVFETMIFLPDTYREVYQDRYSTWAEAARGHVTACLWCEPMTHPLSDVQMWNAPHYDGARDHVFVIVHVSDDKYISRYDGGVAGWSSRVREARVYTHEETTDTTLPEDGRWYAIGRRIYLDD